MSAEDRTYGRTSRQTRAQERWEEQMRGARRIGVVRADFDVTDTPGELMDALRILPVEVEEAGRWWRHLRSLYGQYLEESRRRRDLRDEDEIQRFGAKVAELRARDGRLLHELQSVAEACGYDSRQPESLRALAFVQGETQWLAERLGVSAEAPHNWDNDGGGPELGDDFDESVSPPRDWAAVREPSAMHAVKLLHRRAPNPKTPKRTRGPDLAERQRRASKRKAPKPTHEANIAAKRERQLGRVVALLACHPDGLSANAIREKLHMGRSELAELLRSAVADGRLEQRGSVQNPRYFSKN